MKEGRLWLVSCNVVARKHACAIGVWDVAVPPAISLLETVHFRFRVETSFVAAARSEFIGCGQSGRQKQRLLGNPSLFREQHNHSRSSLPLFLADERRQYCRKD